jgi:hypothetical protein
MASLRRMGGSFLATFAAVDVAGEVSVVGCRSDFLRRGCLNTIEGVTNPQPLQTIFADDAGQVLLYP